MLILVLVLVLEVKEARDSDSEASPRNVRNNTQQSIRTTRRQETAQKAASEMSAAIFKRYVTIMFTIRAFVFLRTCNVTCKPVRPYTGRTAVINKT